MTLAGVNYSCIWVNISSYGKFSDSGIFKNSILYNRLTENSLNTSEPKPVVENGTIPPYVAVADEAFGIMEIMSLFIKINNTLELVRAQTSKTVQNFKLWIII